MLTEVRGYYRVCASLVPTVVLSLNHVVHLARVNRLGHSWGHLLLANQVLLVWVASCKMVHLLLRAHHLSGKH